MAEQGSTKEVALTLVRGLLPIATAGALALTVASTQLPFFFLNVDAIHSSIEQALWHTHVRTPLGHKNVRATDFWKCDELRSAFKGAQSSTFLSIVFGGMAFVFSIYNVTGYFSRTTQRVRWVCGAPLFLFLLLSLVGQLVALAIADAMFYRNWCEGMDSRLSGRSQAVMERAFAASATPVLVVTDSSCDPFDGCVRSFKEMGFVFSVGHQAAWAASVLLSVGILCELLICAFGGAMENEEGEGAEEPTVTLLTTDGYPNDGDARPHHAAGASDNLV